jgi:hypothetical protein
MSDPAVIDRIMQTCSFRFRNVVCPNKDKLAKITAAHFHLGDSNGPLSSAPSCRMAI